MANEYLILEKLHNVSVCLLNLQNSLKVVYNTQEDSCEHYAINEAQKDLCSAKSMLMEIQKRKINPLHVQKARRH